jgi:putative ABC transport system permease protein
MLKPRFIPLVIKQVVRQRTRSILTVCGVAIAMFLFSSVQAMQSGAEQVTQRSANETALIVFRKDRYCPMASRMPQYYADRIEKLDGVASVVPVKIQVTNCRTSLDVVTFRGVPEDEFLDEYGKQFDIIEGAFEQWKSRTDAVLLGETLARRRGLRTGDSFSAAGINVYVAGVVRSNDPQHANSAYSHLPFLQEATGAKQGGYVTQFNVRVNDPTRLDSVAAAIDEEFHSDPDPTQTRSERAFVAAAATDVLEIVGFTRWLGWACLAAVLGLVANAIVLAVQDRVREHAVLQTLGFRSGLLARLIIAEGILLSLFGGAVGTVGAALLLRWLRLTVSVDAVNIPVATHPGVFVSGLVISALLGVLAGLWPAWRASRAPIVESFRAV